jgi:hypothetical protein
MGKGFAMIKIDLLNITRDPSSMQARLQMASDYIMGEIERADLHNWLVKEHGWLDVEASAYCDALDGSEPL